MNLNRLENASRHPLKLIRKLMTHSVVWLERSFNHRYAEIKWWCLIARLSENPSPPPPPPPRNTIYKSNSISELNWKLWLILERQKERKKEKEMMKRTEGKNGGGEEEIKRHWPVLIQKGCQFDYKSIIKIPTNRFLAPSGAVVMKSADCACCGMYQALAN